MRSSLLLCLVLSLASAAHAKDPKPYQAGKLVQMDSVQCSAGSGSKNTHEMLCQEYVVQSERVAYRIRPRDPKHSVLLPVGEQAQFRLQNDKMLLRVEDLDDPYRNQDRNTNSKEREYIVVSMTPRSDSTTADATPSHLNHLQ